MRLFQDPYFVTAMKLLLGFIVFIAQIKLTGKGNLAPATIVDQITFLAASSAALFIIPISVCCSLSTCC